MMPPIGQLYTPILKEKEEVIALARKISLLLDDETSVSFQIGVNALILTITAAIRGSECSLENKIKLANGVSESIIANIMPDAPEGYEN